MFDLAIMILGSLWGLARFFLMLMVVSATLWCYISLVNIRIPPELVVNMIFLSQDIQTVCSSIISIQ